MTQILRGRELLVGDTVEVWWSPGRDTIIAMTPYTNCLSYLWDKDGGARLADFALNKTGMTIEPLTWFTVIHRMTGST